jgi:3-hydroxybutyryl-CoA dehydrogenase
MSELEGHPREPKGRPAVWTEEGGGLCRATREDGGLRRPGGERGNIAVIGAGVMGAGIAQVFLAAGMPVRVYDPAAAAREALPGRIAAGLDLLGQSSVGPLGLLAVAAELPAAVSDADLVIEAAPEALALKRRIFADLAVAAPITAVLASNTSAIPIKEITADLSERTRAARVIGTHFWNPPYLVPLVEVVQARASDPDAVRWTIALLDRIGLKPVHVAADVPGFVGNRLQHALKREAIALVAAGICTAETVDTVTRYGFGARLGIVGPLEQSDLSGLQLTLAIHETLMPTLDNTPVPHPLLVQKVAKGETGAAAGQGFRRWQPGEAESRRDEITRELAGQAIARQTSASQTSASQTTAQQTTARPKREGDRQ